MSEQSNLTNQSQTLLIFDGIDDYVGLPAVNTDYSQGFTVEAWVLYNSFQRFWSRIIDFGNGTAKDNILLANVGTSNTLAFHIYCNSGYYTLEVPNTLELNQWMHLAATIDKSGMAKLYKNGQLIQSKQFALPDNVNRTQNYIGKSNWSQDGYFEGQMTEVRVWNIARTQEEIQQNKDTRLIGNESGLVGYWPLNEGSGNTVTDKTGKGNNGTIYNATWKPGEPPLKNENPSFLVFDGIDDRLEFYKGLPTLDKAVTVEFWAKGGNELNQQTTIFLAQNSQGHRILNAHLPWRYSGNIARIFWDAGNDQGAYDRIDKEVKIEEYNDWTHWAFVKDVNTGKMLIYRNGVIWHQGDSKNKSLGGISKLVIGCNGNAYFWKGYLAEFRIWNYARTPAEIQQDMNDRLVGNEPGLVTYLPLNEDAKDKTSNGNDATIYGTTWLSDQLPLKIKPIASSESQTSKTPEPSSGGTTETLNPPESSNQTIEPTPTPEPSSSATTETLNPPESSNQTIEATPTPEPSSQPKPQEPTQTTRNKRLIVCCDGTWNELTNPCPTNVVKFARLIKYAADDQTPQMVHYMSGCGTSEDDNLIERLGGGAFGWGIDRIIQDAYRFLCMNYDEEAQDEIYLVGFSRGAYIVRCLAGMMYNCGLLRRSNIRKIPEAYELYRNSKIRPNDPESQKFREDNSKKIDTDKYYLQYRVPIKMLGCWDTVGALGIPDIIPWLPIVKLWNRKYEFFDARLSPIVENAFHAVAIDEKRKSFPSSSMEKNQKNPDQVVKEVWFAGEHGCIGGGTKESQGLSDYTLQWMIKEAEKLGLEFYPSEDDREEFQIKPNAISKFDNSVTGVYALGGEEWRSIKSQEIIIHYSVIERFKADPNYHPQNLEPMVKKLLSSNDKT